MATMIVHASTGEREFRVPIAQPLTGAPFEAPSELVIGTAGPDDRPNRMLLRFYPSRFEFQARLPGLVAGHPGFDVFALGLAARATQPVVIFEALPAVVAKLPPGLRSLAAVKALVRSAPKFIPAAYRLAGFDFLDEAAE
jgi:hypothetical protein